MKAAGFLLFCLFAMGCTVGMMGFLDWLGRGKPMEEMRQADLRLKMHEIQERRAFEREEIGWLKAAQAGTSLRPAQSVRRPGFHSDIPLSAEQMLQLEREGRATFTLQEYAAAVANEKR